MTPKRRTTSRPRQIEQEPSQLTSLLTWTIGILLLISTAVVSWIGSFYIFGHPEEPFSYKVLALLKKVEPPKRFEPLSAPRGDFLAPDALYKRYSELNPRQLDELNSILIRNYLRNYQQTKEPVPYAVGQYTILDTFALSPDDYFPSGVVAVARANQDPRVILEQIFPAHLSNVTNLERMLQTGLEINLQKKLDFSAIVHVQKLRDGRIKLLALPLIYGSYASTQGPGTFSLEPPASLNVAAGLPVVLTPRLDAATEKYATYRRKAGLPAEGNTKVAQAPTTNQLLRVQRPEAVDGETPPVPSPTPSPVPPKAVAAATPNKTQVLPALPALPVLEEPPVAPTVPAASPDLVAAVSPSPQSTPTPKPSATAAPSPSPSATPDAIANVKDRKWQVYEPGKMPRGRLRPAGEMQQLASEGLAGERVYLQGNFVVTAASQERAVLRPQSKNPFGDDGSKVRIIVDFPAGAPVPAKNERISRDSSRPFLITNITRGNDGVVNVTVREITKP